jgi:hypothetical protein
MRRSIIEKAIAEDAEIAEVRREKIKRLDIPRP